MKAIQSFLSGKKTFIIAFLMVLVSVVNVITGNMSLSDVLASDDLRLLLEGLGLGFLRAGISKVE